MNVNTNQKVASFRIHADKWADFIEYARSNNRTATSLILDYIDSCIQSGHDYVNTIASCHDKSQSLNTNINYLKNVQNNLVEESNKCNLNIDKLFNAVDYLSQENRSLKLKLEKLEDTVTSVLDNHCKHHEIIDDIATDNVNKIEQLNNQNKVILDELKMLKLQLLTVKELEAMLNKFKVKYQPKTPKPSLIKLAIENNLPQY